MSNYTVCRTVLQARETLGLIDLTSKSEEVARCFTVMPLAKRAASTVCKVMKKLIEQAVCASLSAF